MQPKECAACKALIAKLTEVVNGAPLGCAGAALISVCAQVSEQDLPKPVAHGHTDAFLISYLLDGHGRECRLAIVERAFQLLGDEVETEIADDEPVAVH